MEQAIACWQEHGQQALIELKIAPGCDPGPVARASAAVVTRCWRGDPPVFISFNGAALAATAEAAPQARRALLLEEWAEDWRQRMRAACADVLDIEHSLATRERIDAVHAAGAGVVVWTVNDPARAAALLALGVDAVTTDAIDRITP